MFGATMLLAVAAASATTYIDPLLSYSYDINAAYHDMKTKQNHAYETRRSEDDNKLDNIMPTSDEYVICPENPPEGCNLIYSYENCKVSKQSGGRRIMECPCGKHDNDRDSLCWEKEICKARPGEYCLDLTKEEREWMAENLGQGPDPNIDIRCPVSSRCEKNVCTDPGTGIICRVPEKSDNKTMPRRRDSSEYLKQDDVISLLDSVECRHCLSAVLGKYNKHKYGKPRRQPSPTNLNLLAYMFTS